MKSYRAAFGAGLAIVGLGFSGAIKQAGCAEPAKLGLKQENISKSAAKGTEKTSEKSAAKNSTRNMYRGAEIAAFWKWFAEHQPELSAMQSPEAPIFAQLTNHFKTIDKQLVLEIAPRADGTKELAVSANSSLVLFPLVENIVAAAPTVKGWKIYAFRHKVPPEILKDMSVAAQPAFNGKVLASATPVGVAVKDMRFKLAPDGAKAKVTIFVKDYKADGPQSHMAEMMVQQALGEYDAVKKISSITCEAATVAAAKDAKQFVDLSAAVDKMTRK